MSRRICYIWGRICARFEWFLAASHLMIETRLKPVLSVQSNKQTRLVQHIQKILPLSLWAINKGCSRHFRRDLNVLIIYMLFTDKHTTRAHPTHYRASLVRITQSRGSENIYRKGKLSKQLVGPATVCAQSNKPI